MSDATLRTPHQQAKPEAPNVLKKKVLDEPADGKTLTASHASKPAATATATATKPGAKPKGPEKKLSEKKAAAAAAAAPAVGKGPAKKPAPKKAMGTSLDRGGGTGTAL